uniref:Uncharacterized protein n=1 Tax=Arundo donax TaxID=35708 RepID=A0A0A8YJ48_ARUDO
MSHCASGVHIWKPEHANCFPHFAANCCCCTITSYNGVLQDTTSNK